MIEQKFDVIVVGGGHAGVEAALASNRVGGRTLLLTHNIETVGQMSCNPAIGGIGKGHLVKEIDALGGAMGVAIDHSGIQFRTLNASKGPAVRASRAQADRSLYKQKIRSMVESAPNVWLFQDGVDDIIVENNVVTGVRTSSGLAFYSKTVVLTVGTFLGGLIHIGQSKESGGRAGDPPSIALAKRLRELPFRVGRLKTGTPPRIDGRTLDYSKFIEQPGDECPPVFSFWNLSPERPQQLPCYIAETNINTHAIIKDNIHQSAMYSGQIDGIGPRYCPSIEDKIVRFSGKDRHQIFIEPEGLNVCEIYPNGISTSLPYQVQEKFVRSIVGFESAHITRPGYAIEYDYFDPRDLHPSLETKYIKNLFFAGQINGTTGYEEAAAQGLIAGLNAARLAGGGTTWFPLRHEAYIGVLIDDLTTLGTLEPYRMFTSRAEHRLMLREDNADVRLCAKAHSLGLLDLEKYTKFCNKQESVLLETSRIKKRFVQPGSEDAAKIEKITNKALEREYSLFDLLKRPEITYDQLSKLAAFDGKVCSADVAIQIEVEAKYDGYIKRQELEIARLKRNEETVLPKDLDFTQISGLSNEVIEKLRASNPATLGQASRIPGITPAAVSLLLVYLKKHSRLTGLVGA